MGHPVLGAVADAALASGSSSEDEGSGTGKVLAWVFGFLLLIPVLLLSGFSSASSTLPPWVTPAFVIEALEIQADYGIFASVTIAQAQIEVGGTWDGTSLYPTAALEHNYFGLKAAGGPCEFDGKTTWNGTAGESGTYRKYTSDEQGLMDRAALLLTSDYYSDVAATAYGKGTSAEQAQALSDSPWCENGYTELEAIMEEWDLTRLDDMSPEDVWSLFEAQVDVPHGADYRTATQAQKKVVDTAAYTPSPGGGLCLGWVCDVFAALGNERRLDSAWLDYKATDIHTTGDIPVGAVVYGTGSDSRGCGHIGIYIGDGNVMDNQGPWGGSGSVRVSTLAEWASWQTDVIDGKQGYLGWGWFNNKALR